MFTIMKWPDDSDAKHYATTWVLAEEMTRDKNGHILVNNKEVTVTKDGKLNYDGKTYDPNNNKDDLTSLRNLGFVDTLVKDKNSLIAWDPNYDVPVGVVWYISALRHLEDADGDLGNDIWLPVDPAINKNSFKNEFFTTKLEIETPYISDFVYVPGEKIELTLPTPKTNVTYFNTAIVVKDGKNETILTKMVNLADSQNKITISSQKDDIDFDNYEAITIKLWNIANHSTVSREYQETFLLKQIYFNVVGRKKDLDPYSTNELNLVTKSYTSVEVVDAELMNGPESMLAKCPVIDKETIQVPNNIMSFAQAYTVKLDLLLTYKNGKKDNLEYFVPITTKAYKEEKTPIVKNYEYKNILTNVLKYDDTNTSYTASKDIPINSEEFYTYLTPVFDKENKCVSFYIFGRKHNSFSRFKSKVISLDEPLTIRLLTRKTGYITNAETQNKKQHLILRRFGYNGYSDEIKIENKIITNLYNNNPTMRKIIELGRGYYLAGVSTDDNTTINIYNYMPAKDELTLVAQKKLDNPVEDLSFVEWGENMGLIYIKSDKEIRFYTFTSNTLEIVESITIPSDFRNQNVILERLKNGNIIGFKTLTSDKPLDYFVIDIYTQDVKIYSSNYKGDGELKSIVSLKNGDIVSYLVEGDDVNIYRYE